MKEVLKAELYEIEVSEGIIASIHGCKMKIREIYVPKYNLSFNTGYNNEAFNCFSTYGGRYKDGAKKLGYVEIPKYVEKILKKQLDQQKDKIKIQKWFVTK